MRPSKKQWGNHCLSLGRGFIIVGLLTLATLILWNCARGPSPIEESLPPVWYDYQVVNVYPHDPSAFTQGLLFREGMLFESTGLKGRSTLRKIRLETGDVVKEKVVNKGYFAEGLTDWNDSLLQITWKSGTGYVYDLKTFSLQRTFRYTGEGWGLAHDKDRIIMSDGTSTLRFLDPESLVETGRLNVTQEGEPVAHLNELEVVRGQIFANIWKSDQIVIINARDGTVIGRIDLGGLLSPADPGGPIGVLNGIAYDAAGDRLFVTGKLWPKLFEIRLHPK